MFVTDYVLNSTLYTLYKAEFFDYFIDTLPVSTALVIFPELKKYENENLTIAVDIIGLSEGANDPMVEIMNNETYIQAFAVLTIGVTQPEGQPLNFFKLRGALIGTIDFIIKPGFILDPEIIDLRLEIDEIIEDDTKSLDIDDLNSVLGTATGFIKNYINS